MATQNCSLSADWCVSSCDGANSLTAKTPDYIFYIGTVFLRCVFFCAWLELKCQQNICHRSRIGTVVHQSECVDVSLQKSSGRIVSDRLGS